MDLIKNLIESGVNFTQLSREQAESMVNELVQEGQVRTEECQAQRPGAAGSVAGTNAEQFQRSWSGQQVDDSVLNDLGISGRHGLRKKAPAKKAAAKKAPAKKAPAKKAAAKKAPAKKAAAKKAHGQEGDGQEGDRPRRPPPRRRRRRRRPRRPPG